MKEEGQSLDMEDETRPPHEVLSGTKADRAAKYNSQRGNLRSKPDKIRPRPFL